MAAPLTLVIDGPSGAGKTWLAEYLASHWPRGREVAILHMDDLYHGWHGLAEATQFVDDDLCPKRRAGQTIRWQRWDWVRSQLAEWNELAGDVDLILEGCGSLTAGSAEMAHLSIWLEADDTRRKQWALDRGEAHYDEHWEIWETQFDAFVTRHRPHDHATIRVRSTR